jgi:hypothetical protein
MPVRFLTPEQREKYGRYAASPTPAELDRFFHLNDDDLAKIRSCRGEHNRLGFALQLSTVRYLGTFLDDPVAVPSPVVQTLARQLGISNLDSLPVYRTGKQRWEHVAQIRDHFGYSDITEPLVGFRLARWLYVLCWSGTERPSVLFDRATAWLLAHKILLLGCSTLERFVVRLRSRVETRVWRLLGRGVATSQQRSRLEHLLTTPEGNRGSRLDKLRSGPTRVSGPSLRAAVNRLKSVRELGITVPSAQRIPEGRIASLARFANRAKVSLIARMPPARRLATLVAFIYSLEGTAQDDVLEVLESLLHGLFGNAEKSDQKARLRTLKDLDQATATLADACRLLLDPTLPDDEVRAKVFEKISKTTLESTLENVSALIRPPDDVFYKELNARYGAVRRWLPAVLKHLVFDASPAGRPVVEAYDWLRDNLHLTKSTKDAPRGVIGNAWQRYVLRKDGSVDLHAYTFCMLATAIHRRDVFTKPSWRYADPRANLLNESEWEDMRPVVSRSLGWSAQPQPVLGGADQRTRQNLSRGCTTAIEQSSRSIRNRQRQGRIDPDAPREVGGTHFFDPVAGGHRSAVAAPGPARDRDGDCRPHRICRGVYPPYRAHRSRGRFVDQRVRRARRRGLQHRAGTIYSLRQPGPAPGPSGLGQTTLRP